MLLRPGLPSHELLLRELQRALLAAPRPARTRLHALVRLETHLGMKIKRRADPRSAIRRLRRLHTPVDTALVENLEDSQLHANNDSAQAKRVRAELLRRSPEALTSLFGVRTPI